MKRASMTRCQRLGLGRALSRTLGVPPIWCLWLVVVGCSGSSRESLRGEVWLDGVPLDAGYICFRPEPGFASPTAGGPILAGQFEIDQRGGPAAGVFRVEITASRPTGRTSLDPETGEQSEEMRQYLPARYNIQSELTAEVAAGGRNQFAFQLRSE